MIMKQKLHNSFGFAAGGAVALATVCVGAADGGAVYEAQETAF